MCVEFLTAEEVSERYRGLITVGTLGNWRVMRIGPPFMKMGRQVLYPLSALEAWDRTNMVVCRPSKVVGRSRRFEADLAASGDRQHK